MSKEVEGGGGKKRRWKKEKRESTFSLNEKYKIPTFQGMDASF